MLDMTEMRSLPSEARHTPGEEEKVWSEAIDKAICFGRRPPWILVLSPFAQQHSFSTTVLALNVVDFCQCTNESVLSFTLPESTKLCVAMFRMLVQEEIHQHPVQCSQLFHRQTDAWNGFQIYSCPYIVIYLTSTH